MQPAVALSDWCAALLQSVRDRLPVVTVFLIVSMPLVVGGGLVFRLLPRLYKKSESPFVYTMQ